MSKNEELRKRLIFLKWAKKIKYKDMAYLSDVCESTIYNFVNGRRNGGLHKETIQKLENYLKQEEQQNEEE